MIPSTNTIVRIIKAIPRDNGDPTDEMIAEALYSAMIEMEKISNQREYILRAEQEVRKKHEIELKKYEAELAAAQAKCGHWVRSYESDPSGGSDSYHECEICGKRW